MGGVKAAKVAIVCRDAGGFGGTTRTIIEHAAGLTRAGWDVTVVAERGDRERLEAAGAQCRFVPGWPWGSYVKRRTFAALADRLARGFDAVHGHGDNLRQDVLSLHNCVHAAHEAIHGEALPASNGVGRIHGLQLNQRLFKVLICNSKLMAEDVYRRFGVPRDLIQVIYPGHDPRQFKVADRAKLRGLERRELGWGDDELVVGLITSGDFVKRGVGIFLESLQKLKDRGLRFKALIVGKEARLGPYLKQVALRGLGETVRFAPPRSEVERFYHACDLYAHPALYEEFGQSVQEALACGLPVVCGRSVGAAELLPRSMRDFIVGPSSEELAAALGVALENHSLRVALGGAGPAAVAGNTWAANVAATAAVLDAVRREN